MKHLKVCLVVVFIIMFGRVSFAGKLNLQTEKEIYCKYKKYEVNREYKLRDKIYSTNNRRIIYKECVDSARSKLNFRREMYSEYNISGQQLNRIYRKGNRYKWKCSWFY